MQGPFSVYLNKLLRDKSGEITVFPRYFLLRYHNLSRPDPSRIGREAFYPVHRETIYFFSSLASVDLASLGDPERADVAYEVILTLLDGNSTTLYTSKAEALALRDALLSALQS